MVKQVKLHLIETDTKERDGEVWFRLVYRERTETGRWRRNQVFIERRMPSPLAVIQGEVGDIALPSVPRGRVMFDDVTAYRAVWEEVAQRVRVGAAGRRFLIDSIDEAVAHEAEEMPRRVATSRVRDAAWREANGYGKPLP